jgi:branched-chain amino acid transport system ATP-binding protein
MATLLDASGVTMRFGGLVAVNDVSLQVGDGEIVGLIGPNGAGKTTFFNCLTGLYKPTEGQVRFRGEVLTMKPYKVTQAGIARTFQNIRLFANMSALENVMVGRHCRTSVGPLSAIGRGPKYRREEAESRERSTELLDFVGLQGTGEHLARNLPYGSQRRLEIARALATDPGLILLDEPTAGMNPQETREAQDLVFKIRDAGVSVVVIEHDMRFIFALCDRVACLVRGEKIIEDAPAVVQSDPRVIEAYIGAGPDLEPGIDPDADPDAGGTDPEAGSGVGPDASGTGPEATDDGPQPQAPERPEESS